MTALVVLALALVVYFLPAIIAYDRNNPSRAGIFVLNLFLGWTFIGWVVSLAWAFTGERQERSAEQVEANRRLARNAVIGVGGIVLLILIAGLLGQNSRPNGTGGISSPAATTSADVSNEGASDGAAGASKAGGWEVSTASSPMDGSKTVILSRSAEAPVSIWLGEKTPELVVRCRESKTEVYVVTGTAAQPEMGSYDVYTVRVRLDDRAARTQHWSESTDNTSLFSSEPLVLAKQLSASSRLRFEFTPFNSSPAVAEFNLSGLRDVLPQIASACHWRAP